MKKILISLLATMAFATSTVSAKTATQIKNENRAKAYKEKQAQKKAAKAAAKRNKKK